MAAGQSGYDVRHGTDPDVPGLASVTLVSPDGVEAVFVPAAGMVGTSLTLDGVAYLGKTTWPISTVFRLYLENLNWVPNAETVSGPTPPTPPEYADFLAGVLANVHFHLLPVLPAGRVVILYIRCLAVGAARLLFWPVLDSHVAAGRL